MSLIVQSETRDFCDMILCSQKLMAAVCTFDFKGNLPIITQLCMQRVWPYNVHPGSL